MRRDDFIITSLGEESSSWVAVAMEPQQMRLHDRDLDQEVRKAQEAEISKGMLTKRFLDWTFAAGGLLFIAIVGFLTSVLAYVFHRETFVIVLLAVLGCVGLLVGVAFVQKAKKLRQQMGDSSDWRHLGYVQIGKRKQV
jgi:lipopolysaccharide/colanic/teichoic acid biosynthesis glycosyltransferase